MSLICQSITVEAVATSNPMDGFVPVERHCTNPAAFYTEDDLPVCVDCAKEFKKEGFHVREMRPTDDPEALHVRLKILRNSKPPEYMTPGASAMDVSAAIDKPIELRPGHKAKIPLGFALAIPTHYVGFMRSRSGLPQNDNIKILWDGTIDSDYRGELFVTLLNDSFKRFIITPGMRVAQFVIVYAPRIKFEFVEELDKTARGDGGFGSTGK